MKKLLSLTLALLMVMTLMSCTQKKKTAYEIITDAQAKLSELEAFSMNVDTNLEFGTQGITFGIPISADVKASGITSDAPKASINAEMLYMGLSINLDFYYDNEYLYISAMGTNVKFNTKELTDTLPDEDSSSEAETIQEEFDEILKEALAEAIVQENEDKSQTITYTINGEKLNNFINKLSEETTETQSQEIKLSDLEIIQTVDKDGYITVSEIKCTLSVIEDLGEEGEILGMETIEVTFDIDATVTLNDPGTPVEVTPMDGYEAFEEVSPEEALPEDLGIII